MSERVDLRITAPEWRPVTEGDLNKMRLRWLLPLLALEHINARTTELDDAHRKGWKPDAHTINAVMHVKRQRERLVQSYDGFIHACLVLDRAEANVDAWKRNKRRARA